MDAYSAVQRLAHTIIAHFQAKFQSKALLFLTLSFPPQPSISIFLLPALLRPPLQATDRMLSLSSLVVAIQGLFGILNGAASLLFPSLAQKTIETLQISLPAVHAIALGSITIGAFYLNAASRGDRTAMWWMVLGRVIAIPVFLGHGGPWMKVAGFEAVCGVLIVGSLGWEYWRSGKQVKRE